MPGEKRKVPLEAHLAEPEEWDALGLPRSEVVISPASAKPSWTPPNSATKTSPTGPKPPKPGFKNT
jgi:hypothetical protein